MIEFIILVSRRRKIRKEIGKKRIYFAKDQIVATSFSPVSNETLISHWIGRNTRLNTARRENIGEKIVWKLKFHHRLGIEVLNEIKFLILDG